MFKIFLLVLYFVIGLYFMSQIIGMASSDKYKNSHKNKKILFISMLLAGLSELFLWPICIVVAAGYVHGKKNYDEEYSESDESIN